MLQYIGVYAKLTFFCAVLVFVLGVISGKAETKQGIFLEAEHGSFMENPVSYADLNCMAKNIYHESKNQSKLGMIAVARVVINRKRDSRWPSTVCEVIQQGPVRESWKTRQNPDLPDEDRVYYPVKNKCQFSWYCDGKADNVPSKKNNLSWNLAEDIAWEVLKYDRYAGIVEGATHYHADYVTPKWSKTITLITKIDDHIFYRWD